MIRDTLRTLSDWEMHEVAYLLTRMLMHGWDPPEDVSVGILNHLHNLFGVMGLQSNSIGQIPYAARCTLVVTLVAELDAVVEERLPRRSDTDSLIAAIHEVQIPLS